MTQEDKLKKIKVLVTGNFESEPNRFYHRFLQDNAETVIVPKPSDYFLVHDILEPLLGNVFTYGPWQDAATHNMLEAYHWVTQYNPFFVSSIRNLENLSKRVATLIDECPLPLTEDDVNRQVLRACICEFASGIRDGEQRQAYIDKITELIQPGHVVTAKETEGVIDVGDGLYTTPQKAYVIDALEQAIMTRRRVMRQREPPGYFKKGLLIEGEAGLGKATICESILKKRGFSKDARDTTNR